MTDIESLEDHRHWPIIKWSLFIVTTPLAPLVLARPCDPAGNCIPMRAVIHGLAGVALWGLVVVWIIGAVG